METVDTSALEKTAEHLALGLRSYGEHRGEAIGEVLRSGVVQSFNVCWGRIRPTVSRALIRLDGLDRDQVKEMSLGSYCGRRMSTGIPPWSGRSGRSFLKRGTTGKYLGRFSDLDLAVATTLALGVRSELLEALDESDLPIKVDLVELDRVDAGFVERIRGDFVVVREGGVRKT